MASIAVAIRYASNMAELSNNLKQGINQIEALNATAEKMADRLGGQKMIQSAHNLVAAIDKVGVSTLTAGQAATSLNQLERAMEKLEASGKPIPAAMQQTADSLKKVAGATTQADDAGNKWIGSLKTLGAAIGITFSLGAAIQAGKQLIAFLGDCIKEFAAAEASSKKLDVALKAQGQTAPAVRAGYDQLAKQFQILTVYSDDLITEMQSLFVQVGNVGPAQMKSALQAAADLSAGLGIELPAATMMLAKAFAGGGEELGRLKQVIKATLPEGASMEQVLAAVNAQFGGQAAAQIGTYTGQIAQLENQWGDIKESIGGVIAETGILSGAMVALKFKLAESQAGMSVFSDAVKASTSGLPPHVALLKLLAGAHSDVSKEVVASETPMEAFSRVNDAARAKMASLRAEAERLRTVGITPLTSEQKDLVRAFDAAGVSAGDIAQKLGVSTAAVTQLTGASKKAQTETNAYTQSVRDLASQYSGGKMAADVRLMSDALIATGGAAKMTAFEKEKLGKQLQELKAQGATLPNNLHAMWLEYERLHPTLKVTTDVYKGLDAILKASPPAIIGLQKPVSLLQQEFSRLISNDPYSVLNRVGTVVKGLAPPFQGALEKARELSGDIQILQNRGASGAQVLDEYGDAAVQAAIDLLRMGGSLDMLPEKVRTLAEEAERLKARFAFADKIEQIGSVVANVGGQIASELGGRWGDAVGHASAAFGAGASSIASFMKGDIIGGIQAGVSAVIGFGKTISAVFGNETKGARDEFAKGMNLTTDELLKKLQSLGAEGQRLANQALNVIGKHDQAANQAWMKEVTAFFEKNEADIKRTADVLAKYGEAWTNLPAAQQAKQIAADVKTLAEEHVILTANGYSSAQATKAQAAAYNDLLAKALQAGVEIPGAMLPALLRMAELGQITEANMRAMLGLKDESLPDFKAMEEAAKKYGIELGDLGPKFQQAKLNDLFKGLLSDFNLLRDGGANMAVVIEKMGPQVNDAVQQAIRFGAEIPASMRPMIEAMARAGQLVGENGEKLTDLGGLKWATPIEESMKELVKLFKELIAAMGGAKDAANAIPSVITVGVEWDVAKFPGVPGGTRNDGEVESAHSGAIVAAGRIQRFHNGVTRVARVLPFPRMASDEVPAILQTGEAVLRRQAVDALGADAVAALNGAGRGGRSESGSRASVTDLSAVTSELQALRSEQARRDAGFAQTLARAVRDEMQKVVNQ